MKLRFTNPRKPETIDDLDPVEREQLAAAGAAWDGRALSAEDRIGDDPSCSFRGVLTLWDLVDEDDGGALVYTFFHYAVDSGAFYRAGTTELDADVIQDDLHDPKSPEVARAIAEAVERQRAELSAAKTIVQVPDSLLS